MASVVMRIALITKPGHVDSGVSCYTRNLEYNLSSLGYEVVQAHPVVPLPRWLLKLIHNLSGWDLETFFNNYPIWIQYPDADIFHLISQNMATIILFRKPPGQTLITVHDLIPWDLRNNPPLRVYQNKVHKFFDWLALKGIRRIDWVISISSYSADVLISALHSKSNVIDTVSPEVD
jgi:hypothetical protein